MRKLLYVASILSAAPAIAQDINIDFGSAFGSRSNTHAGAGQAGEWNTVLLPSGAGAPLFDINGTATAATVTTQLAETEFSFDNLGTSGDDQALLDDGFDPGAGNSVLFTGLDDGTYTVITYAWAPDSDLFETGVSVVGSSDPLQSVGGPWTGTYLAGEQYAEHTVDVVGGSLQIDLTVITSFATCNGVQLAKGGGIGSNYCVAAANSVSAMGSLISAAGSTSLAASDVTLTANNAPSQPAIFYFGPDQVNIAFGNGNRCVGGSVTRMPVVFGAGGLFTYSIDFSTYGPTIGSLGTVNFQCWYRDPAAGGAAFNLSDGTEIVFVP